MAVDGQDLAVDHPRLVGGQEDRLVGDIRGLNEGAHRDLAFVGAPEVGFPGLAPRGR